MADETVFRFVLVSEGQGGPPASGVAAPGRGGVTPPPVVNPVAGPLGRTVDPKGVPRALEGTLAAMGIRSPMAAGAGTVYAVHSVLSNAMEGSATGTATAGAGALAGAGIGGLLGGPLGAGVGAGVGAYIGNAVGDKLKEWDRVIKARSAQLAEFSPVIANTIAQQEQEKLTQDIIQANRLGPAMAENVRLRGRLERVEQLLNDQKLAASNQFLKMELAAKEKLIAAIDRLAGREPEVDPVRDIDAFFGNVEDLPIPGFDALPERPWRHEMAEPPPELLPGLPF